MEKLDIKRRRQDSLIILVQQKTVVSIICISVLALFLGFYAAELYNSVVRVHYNLAGLIKFIAIFGPGITIFFLINRKLGLFFRFLGWFWASAVTSAGILFIFWLH